MFIAAMFINIILGVVLTKGLILFNYIEKGSMEANVCLIIPLMLQLVVYIIYTISEERSEKAKFAGRLKERHSKEFEEDMKQLGRDCFLVLLFGKEAIENKKSTK